MLIFLFWLALLPLIVALVGLGALLLLGAMIKRL